jgi:hypothetical protein
MEGNTTLKGSAMKTPRHTPTAPELRQYFEQTGFVLAHRCAPTSKPEAWWLADVDGTPYPMPSHWRASSLPEGNMSREVEEFPSLPRLWRAWAATQHRFAREARCIELIKERVISASADERREVVRWIRSGGMAYPASGDEGAPAVDFDGRAVDETQWPWSAVTWEDGGMIGTGWPWTMAPESPADGLEIQQQPDWAQQALVLYWFDTRYVESYFEAVKAVLVDVLPELSGNRPDGGPGEAHWVLVGNEAGTPPSLH